MITQKYLKSILHYNPETGMFKWIARRVGVCVEGVAGSKKILGYMAIQLNEKSYLSHRLAFLYMTGEWPKDQIDHINQIKSDNRWCNLRECTQSQNMANQKMSKTNTSGYKGVSWDKISKNWRAGIKIDKKSFNLGGFKNKRDAALAYNKKALEIYGEFSNLNIIKGVNL